MPLTFEELQQREGSQEVELPQHLQKDNIFEKVGQFVAPTTTGIVKGLAEGEKPTLKQLLGGAFEVAAWFIPAGAILRGARIAKAAVGLGKAAKPLTFGTLAKAGQKLGKGAKEAATIGGVSGAAFGAGGALGDEDAGIKDIAGQAALTGAAGAAGGAVLAPALSLVGMGVRGITSITSRAFRSTNKSLGTQSRKEAVDSVVDAYKNSFVEDKAAITNKLDSLMVRARKAGGPKTADDLIREAVEEGYLPTVEGALGNQRINIDDLVQRRSGLSNLVDETVAPIKKTTSIKELQEVAEKTARGRTDVDLDKIIKQMTQVFKSLEEKHGPNLSALQINDIRKAMNFRSKSFNNEAFILDTQFAIANAARGRLDILAPAVRGINKEMGKLFRIEETLRVFHNKKISIGEFAQAMGRYAGVIGIGGPLAAVGGVATGLV